MAILSKYGVPFALSAMPKVMQVAIPLLGTKEVVGRGSNRTILGWRDELNAAYGVDSNAAKIVGYSDDDIPWCGLGEAYFQWKAGKKVVANPLWARNWGGFGVPVAERINNRLVFYRDRVPSFSDVLVFGRAGGGGHVGNYVCENETHFAVLGCNQSNAVTIAPIEKDRCIAVRRAVYKIGQPASVVPVHVSRIPGRTSVNEA